MPSPARFSADNTANANATALRWALWLYVLFIISASLYTERGWQPFPGDLLAFLNEPLPRWITRTDVATNLLVYLPLGYLLRVNLSYGRHPWLSVFWATLLAAALSFSMETLQQALPLRKSGLLDWLVNSLGGLAGSIVSLHHQRGRRGLIALRAWRLRWFQDLPFAHYGLALLGLWFIAQFSLRPLPGIGWLNLHLRPLETRPDSFNELNFDWFFAHTLEMLVLGAFLACLLRPGRYVGALTLWFISAFLAKVLTATILLKWNAVGGLMSMETLGAFFVAFWLLLLPGVSRHRRRLAIVGLLACIAWRLFEGGPLLWPKHSLLNLVGLAATIAAWWPLLALGVLGMQRVQSVGTVVSKVGTKTGVKDGGKPSSTN